jgi:glycosyltransferase involved in cell wall biosynthesis
MKVGLNLLYLIPGCVGGVQTYAEGLLQGLSELDHRHEFTVWLNQKAAAFPLPRRGSFIRRIVPVNGRNRACRYAFEQLVLPMLVRRERIDVLHSLGYVGPVVSPCATVVTLHDLNFMRLKQNMGRLRHIALSYFAVRAATHADHVITVSEFSRREMCRELGLPAERVSVIYHGPPDGGCAFTGETTEIPPVLPERYVVAFAGGNRHKNVGRLILAFHEASSGLPHHLVLVGNVHSTDRGHLGERVVSTGYLSAAALRQALGGAELFIFPSLYEGFGLPVLEAQRAGIPVACSNVAAIPEVAGKGAAYFSPESTSEMAQTIKSCLCDSDRRRKLIADGAANLERFSWAETARQTVQAYEFARASRQARLDSRKLAHA